MLYYCYDILKIIIQFVDYTNVNHLNIAYKILLQYISHLLSKTEYVFIK